MSILYRCCECGRTFHEEGPVYVCARCGDARKPGEPLRGVLRVDLPWEDLGKSLDRETFHPHPLLPAYGDSIPAYPVGGTPLVAPGRIRRDLGYPGLHLKDEGLNPTGSLKDRASLLVAAQALHHGIDRIVVASTGNAASAMAGVAAFCGLRVKVYVPAGTPPAKLAQISAYGAEIVTVDGTYDDAFELSLEDTRRGGGLNRNTAYNPMTIEGKKTAALEIFMQLGGRAPDAVFVPVGDGVILSGISKGFRDLVELGWIEKPPRLVAVQAAGCDAFVRGLETGAVTRLPGAATVADSIRVEAPRNGIMALQDVAAAGGFGVRVSDEAILSARSYLGRMAGVYSEPAAACAFAGFLAARAEVPADALAVVLLTGSGLKDTAVARAPTSGP